MAKTALLIGPLIVGIGALLLLKAAGASSAVAFVVLAFIAVLSGGTIGVFADRLPELPDWTRLPRRASSRS